MHTNFFFLNHFFPREVGPLIHPMDLSSPGEGGADMANVARRAPKTSRLRGDPVETLYLHISASRCPI